jgi:2-polyprenyl-3-methyl-5-hydroxy-6-metoxy-1,4-benzoquinol methylase
MMPRSVPAPPAAIPAEARSVSIWRVEHERRAELMDDPALPAGEHLAALDALATINAVSLTGRQLASAVARLVGSGPPGDRPLEIVDVACGGGDITIALAHLLGRRLSRPDSKSSARRVRVLGIDLSERAIERARAAAARRPPGGGASVEFASRDVLAEGLPPCDIAVSSLFLHHLDDPAAATVLRSMATAARLGGVVSDLVRSRTGLVLAILGTTFLARSRVARVDGPLSVRAARTPAEYRALADRAGLAQAVIHRTWPERVLVEWRSAEPVTELAAGVACA